MRITTAVLPTVILSFFLSMLTRTPVLSQNVTEASFLTNQEIVSTANIINSEQSHLKREEYIKRIFKACSEQPEKVNTGAIRAIGDLMSADDDIVRYWAAASLGKIGVRAKITAGVLLKALKERQCREQSLNSTAPIRYALERMGEELPPWKCH